MYTNTDTGSTFYLKPFSKNEIFNEIQVANFRRYATRKPWELPTTDGHLDQRIMHISRMISKVPQNNEIFHSFSPIR